MTSSIGKLFIVTSFGESHGKCVGVVIDGCPAGLPIRDSDIQHEIDLRKPAAGAGSTTRAEKDEVEILSGIFEGVTTGAPISMMVRNNNADSREYEKTRFIPRPGHADYTAFIKYGGFNDYRGGGRFSGRITAGFVMAGAVAKALIHKVGIEVVAHTIQIGKIKAANKAIEEIKQNSLKSPVRCSDVQASRKMIDEIKKNRKEGDSLGGIVEAIALNVPAGLGEPLFDTIEGEIAKAVFAIPAIKGIEFGRGFNSAGLKGSENNDPYDIKGKHIVTTSNNAGGILGGISTGMPIVLRAAVKPTPSISISQQSVNLEKMKKANLNINGRHDTCIVPRVVPVVESMVAVVLADLCLRAGILPGVIK